MQNGLTQGLKALSDLEPLKLTEDSYDEEATLANKKQRYVWSLGLI